MFIVMTPFLSQPAPTPSSPFRNSPPQKLQENSFKTLRHNNIIVIIVIVITTPVPAYDCGMAVAFCGSTILCQQHSLKYVFTHPTIWANTSAGYDEFTFEFTPSVGRDGCEQRVSGNNMPTPTLPLQFKALQFS